MDKRNMFFLILFTFFIPVLLFAQEELRITTYYPSPNGSYGELGTDKLAVNVSGAQAAGPNTAVDPDNRVAVSDEYDNMRNGDAHIGWSMIVGAGKNLVGGSLQDSGFAYDQLTANRPGDGTLLVKDRIGIGTNAPAMPLQIVKQGPEWPAIIVEGYGVNPAGTIFSPHFIARGARGTIISPSVVSQNDTLMVLRGVGYGATAWATGPANLGAADIRFVADGVFNNASAPGRIELRTSPSGSTQPVNRVVIKENGRVGIGTDGPGAFLHINYPAPSDGLIISNSNNNNRRLFSFTDEGGGWGLLHIHDDDGLVMVRINPSGDSYFTNVDPSVTTIGTSRIGINTRTPQYNLDVSGTIRATGGFFVGIDPPTGLADGTSIPDFVFKPGYKVFSTAQVEKYLREKGHLPWMTSAEQEKKENGNAINMTRMTFQAVETAENLQLQLIEQHKQLLAQQKTIASLEKKIKGLEGKIK